MAIHDRERALDVLQDLRDDVDAARWTLSSFVTVARAEGMSWDDIQLALGPGMDVPAVEVPARLRSKIEARLGVGLAPIRPLKTG